MARLDNTTSDLTDGTSSAHDIALSVRDLAVRFDLADSSVRAVDHNSFDLRQGETLGLVGESGSGKSVTARAIMGLIEDPGVVDNGSVNFEGRNLLECSESEMEATRGRDISMVFQDPLGSLNPVFTIGKQFTRILELNRDLQRPSKLQQWLRRLPGGDTGLSEIEEYAVKILKRVGIPDPVTRLSEYPHQMSGGQRQRILIGMAIAAEPDILIADEPTTALDVTIEAQIFDLISELQEELGMSVLLITHDLSVVADVADRVMIMYGGNIVEKASIYEAFDNPQHPYTKALIDLIPRTDRAVDELKPIAGEVPDLSNVPSGCPFHPRCPKAVKDCSEVDPELQEVRSAHHAACIELEGYSHDE
jgi:oligopeptide/dipeptide ABC transporter ATP-binding protein